MTRRVDMDNPFNNLFNDDFKTPVNRLSNYLNTYEKEIEIEIEYGADPDETIDDYLELLYDADSLQEFREILEGLFYEGMRYGMETILVGEIQAKAEALSKLNQEFEDEDY